MNLNKKVPFMYYFGRTLFGPLIKFWYHPKIINKEYIPKTGRIIIAGNHKHLNDQYLTIIATKRGIHYLAKKEYFDNPLTRWYFKGVGCISVDRQNKDPVAKNMAIDVLNDDGAIGIFPEGTRNRTDKLLLPFKYGCVSMAKKTDALIVPFAITGDYKFRSKNLTIKYGPPFKVTDMDLAEANQKLTDIITKLLTENEQK